MAIYSLKKRRDEESGPYAWVTSLNSSGSPPLSGCNLRALESDERNYSKEEIAKLRTFYDRLS